MNYNFNVSGDRISLSPSKYAVSGSANYYRCVFSFSEEWATLTKFAVFVCADKTFTVKLEDGSCFIPEEVLKKASPLSIGVYGTDLNGEDCFRISTDFTHIVIMEGAFKKGTSPKIPSKELWEVYFKNLEDMALKSEKIIEVTVENAKNEIDNLNKNAVKEATTVTHQVKIYPGQAVHPGDKIVDFHATAQCKIPTDTDTNGEEIKTYNFSLQMLNNGDIDLILTFGEESSVLKYLPFIPEETDLDFNGGTIANNMDVSYIEYFENPILHYIVVERKTPIHEYVGENIGYAQDALDKLINQQEEIIKIQNELIGGEAK